MVQSGIIDTRLSTHSRYTYHAPPESSTPSWGANSSQPAQKRVSIRMDLRKLIQSRTICTTYASRTAAATNLNNEALKSAMRKNAFTPRRRPCSDRFDGLSTTHRHRHVTIYHALVHCVRHARNQDVQVEPKWQLNVARTSSMSSSRATGASRARLIQPQSRAP